MSSIAVNAITDANAGNTATINAVTPNVNNVLGKNRIINGNMMIDQRNAGASVTQTTGVLYPVDRFYINGTVTSKFTAQQNAGSVTPPAGFINYLGMTSSSAYTVGASEAFQVLYRIEGLNIADLGWGAASAATVTLSFWVRSSLTGTFSGALRNSAVNRSYPFSYTISSANTWEQKSLTIAGDTSGTWLTTNGTGIIASFSLGAGSTFSGTAGAWAAANYASATGATSVVGTNGATFYITGVQLEAGSSATEFEHRQYGTELQLCQRYYQGNKADGTQNTASGNAIFRASSTGTGSFYYWMPFATYMRASPTMNVGTPTYSNASSAAFFNAKPNGAEILISVSVSGGYAVIPWRAEAEL
jgi:hypothetical protein